MSHDEYNHTPRNATNFSSAARYPAKAHEGVQKFMTY